MTILHAYVATVDKGAEAIQAYFVSRDVSALVEVGQALQDALALVQAEIQDPSIQETGIRIPGVTSEALNASIRENNSVILGNGGLGVYVADGPIVAGKFIRVSAGDQPDNSAFLFKVVLLNEAKDQLILAPVTPI